MGDNRKLAMTCNGNPNFFTTLSLNPTELDSLSSLTKDFFKKIEIEIKEPTQDQLRFTLLNLLSVAQDDKNKIIKKMLKVKLI